MKKAIPLISLLFTISLFAVTPYFWELRTYDEFRQGKLTSISLTSEDQLMLAPRFDMVFNTEQPLIFSAAADSKGNVYLGTGHDGKVYRVDPSGKGEVIADFAELDVLSLAIDGKDVLYAATSPDGKIYRIESAKQPETFFDPDVKYVWSMVFDRQGRLIVGTGDKGVIYRVSTDGKSETFYDTDETHVISLAIDRDGNVIAGGDPKGYIYRISPAGQAFVLFDSGMREVHAFSIAPDGRIFAVVLSGSTSLPRNTTATAGTDRPSVTVTVTPGFSQNAAQDADVVVAAPTDAATADTPRASSRRQTDGPTQSVILEILPDGTVNTIWRQRDEMIYSILPRGNRVLFSTGAKGRIYAYEPSRNTTLLVESTEEQTTRLLVAGNRVMATSSNAGKLFVLGDGFSPTGTYESPVRDTDAISTWGKVSWRSESPTLIQIFTRSGNTNAPDRTWSDWAMVDTSGTAKSPNARFVQWKAVLTADRGRSPVLHSVTVPYLQQNFRPEVTGIDVLPPGVALVKVQQLNASGTPTVTNDAATARANARAGQPPPAKAPPRRVVQKGAQSFQWTATDRNQDVLKYDVYYRGETESAWKVLKREVEDTFYTINSDTLPDGTYVLRIAAGDLPSNPTASALVGEMETRPFTIDNTPPTITMKQESMAGGRVRIAIEAADPTSTLNQAEISVDTGEWRSLFPRDGITDSKSESFVYQSEALSAGEHVIAFRIYDQVDNVGLGKLVVRIP